MTSDPFLPVETARLRLRCVAAADAATTATLMTPAISRWVANWPVPFTHEMAAQRIKAARDRACKGDALPFAVTDKALGELIGWVMVSRNRDDLRRGSLGYWLGEKHHRKGYMRELAPAVVAAGFELLDLDVIDAAAQPENIASLAVMRACGMLPVGEGAIYASARQSEEFCHFYEIRRPRALNPV
jgi:[ribosomal protein S5]-alanine N-acetyltransferase